MLILENGILVTMDAKKNILKNSAIVIDGNKIAAMGEKESIKQKYSQKNPKIIDCTGKAIFPGFINTHIHSAQSIVRGMAEDLGRAPSYTASVPQGDDLTESESYVFSLLGAATALRFGSTLISDNYANSMVNAKAFEDIGIRAFVSERVHDIVFYGLADGNYEKDEALGETLFEKNIALFEKYGNSEGCIQPCWGPHAPDTCSRELLKRIADAAKKNPAPVTTHLAQSRMELDRVREVYHRSSTELLKECGLLNEYLMAAHGVFLTEEDMMLLSDGKVQMIHIPEGNAKAGAIANVYGMQDKGLNVAIGTDNGAGNMIENMRMALIAGRMNRHCVTNPLPQQILEMATINGAKALHMEQKIGSLEVGKLADIVIVDYDSLHMTPCTNVIGNLVHLGLGSDVETVIVNGEIVVEHGRVLHIEEKEVMRDARQIARLKWAKSDPSWDTKYSYIF